MSTSPRVIFRHDYFQKMIGSERPVYLEYDLPDADFLKKKEEDKDKNPSDDEFSICSIPSAEVGNDLKNDLFKEVGCFPLCRKSDFFLALFFLRMRRGLKESKATKGY